MFPELINGINKLTRKHIMSEQYSSFDTFWCQEFFPISEQFDKLRANHNRYQDFFLYNLKKADDSLWLVKPADGFVSDEHEAAYKRCYIANSNNGAAFRIGPDSHYASGYVFGAYAPDSRNWFGRTAPGAGLSPVPNSIQPFAGWGVDAHNASRIRFEDWWLSGRALRSAWRIQNPVGRIATIDGKFAFAGKTSAARAALQAKYPGWRPEDGSSPETPAL